MAHRRGPVSDSGYDPGSDEDVYRVGDEVPRSRVEITRNLVGFWLLGLCNNFAYVIMLSAAKDILEGGGGNSNSTENSCRDNVNDRSCHPMSTGSVLLADILPALLVKLTAPFYVYLLPFGLRHTIVVLLQAMSFLIVAMSNTVGVALTGVALASFGSGLGEISYLSLAAHFHVQTVSFWSSGTGGAGIFGSLAYAVMTEKKFLAISPRHTLLSMLVIPLLFAFAFWSVLRFPPTIHRVKLTDWRSFWVPISRREYRQMEHAPEYDDNAPLLPQGETHRFACSSTAIRPLVKFIIPLVTVYFGEYFINQGLVELLEFDCSHGFHLNPESQYRWGQVFYQLGVFISRSSSDFYSIPSSLLPLLAILQLFNALLFFIDAIEYFLPHISVVFCIILYEGLLGGAAYVNTFRAIHDEIAPDRREFSMGVVSISDTLGIVFSGFLAIPVHNWICSKPF